MHVAVLLAYHVLLSCCVVYDTHISTCAFESQHKSFLKYTKNVFYNTISLQYDTKVVKLLL
nr:MAG TPA: hypothetical protein [Caudoviricetes sp.]